MAMPIGPFDSVGEPETLFQRWTEWKEQFDIYIVTAHITDPKVKQARLLFFGGPELRGIYNNFTDAEKSVPPASDIFKVTSGLFDNYFTLKKCVPKLRQNFLGTNPMPGETVNDYIIRLKSIVNHCDYGDDAENQVRDRVIWHIKDVNLRSRLYREDDLSMTTLVQVIWEYQEDDDLILVPEEPSVGKYGQMTLN